MGGPLSLTGPDLAAGVPIASVPTAGLLRGHAFGEAIVVARVGAAFTAFGAACTHYGAPLDEGLRVGDTVRCPWHHACFDLATGEAVRAPALRPLSRFAVEARDGVVRVTGLAPAFVGRPARGPGPESVVVVGAGAAAAAAVEALRVEGYAGPVTMIGREPEPPVDRPNLSKDYLAGTAPEEWMAVRDDAFYASIGVRRVVGEVTALDPANRRVTCDGHDLAYGACVLAPGADPIRLPIPGADRPHVHTLRTFADSRAIVAAVGQRAVVIGASFIGLEVAASLRARGAEVHVVAPEAVPLERVLGAELGAHLRGVHEAHGVVFHLGLTPSAIEADAVVLSDGSRVPADLVVMGVGVRPAVALAERAGLATDRGVVVDATLATSAAGVWAAGDVAKWPDPHTGQPQRIEHWVLAQRQGQTAARNVLGHGEQFDAVPFFWSAHYDVIVNYVGFPGGDRVVRLGRLEDGAVAYAFRKGDVTFAVATLFRDDVCLEAERLLERDDQDGLRRLIPEG